MTANQELYEDELAGYWQKKVQIKELIDTNERNHPLRLKSIKDRQKELTNIQKQLEVIKQKDKDVYYPPPSGLQSK